MLVAYTLIGTRDVARAGAFYDAVLAPLGAVRNTAYSSEKRVWYMAPGSSVGMLAVGLPFEGEASAGNGTMIALFAPDTATVAAVHAKAMEQGAQDEGAPGIRGLTWHGAYFRDPDGNKIAVFTMVKPKG